MFAQTLPEEAKVIPCTFQDDCCCSLCLEELLKPGMKLQSIGLNNEVSREWAYNHSEDKSVLFIFDTSAKRVVSSCVQ